MEKQGQQVVQPYRFDNNMSVKADAGSHLVWHSPLDEPFRVSGFAWFAEERLYRRLPLKPDFPIPPAVDLLANCTSGGQIRFQTDSRTVAVRVRLAAPTGMYHMAPTGEGGVDAYIGTPGNSVYAGTARFEPGQQDYESELFVCETSEMRSFTLNMPLYQGVTEMWIGLEPGAVIKEPAPYSSNKRVIFYGTSITQGGCASRPGMSYTNILSRRMNLEFINLGFSGNGKGEPELAHLIAQIDDPACLVLDYEGNCGTTESYRQTLPAFIRIYRDAHPNIPIIVVSRIPYTAEAFKPEILQGRLERKQFQSELVRQLTEDGDRLLTFVDGSNLLGNHPAEATVDGVHPTDLGFMSMADGVESVLKDFCECR